ncbi:MAG: signal peptidase I [Chloroflexi bacterium]|nr:signal peptidase I [Chloroflexota bacterium]
MKTGRREDDLELTNANVAAWKIANRVLGAEKEMPCRIVSRSMSPFLRINDIVWLRPITVSELRFGDILLFDDNGKRIVHRFLKRGKIGDQEVLITKGDALPHEDLPIPENQLLAIVVRVERGSRKIDLESRSGRLLNVTIGILSSCPHLLPVARIIWRLLGVRRLKVLAGRSSQPLPKL